MKILIVDISGFFMASWHKNAGESIDAAYHATVDWVRRIQTRDEYARTILACDSRGPTWRHKLDATYKAQRPPRDEACMAQLRRVEERFAADGIRTLRADGFEADDVIASLVHGVADCEIVIASGDKDMLQLVGTSDVSRSRVTVESAKGESYDAEAVQKKYGLAPSQFRDFLALKGDDADNVPGIKGVGLHHATRLLAAHGSIEGILMACDVMDEKGKPTLGPPAIRKAILEGLDVLARCRQLVTLRTDALPAEVLATVLEPVKRAPAPAEYSAHPYDLEELAAIQGEPMLEDVDVHFVDRKDSSGAIPPAASGATLEVSHPTREQTQPAAAPVVVLAQDGDGGPSRALALRPAEWSMALEPRDSGSAWKLAQMLYNSRLFGAYGNPEAVLATILRGRSLGMDATTALSAMHIIEGKPSLSAQTMIALVLRSGKARYFRLVRTNTTEAAYRTLRVGDDEEPLEIAFTMEDARRAGLAGKNVWQKYPAQMLRARAATDLARAVYPDVVGNMYAPEELEEAS